MLFATIVFLLAAVCTGTLLLAAIYPTVAAGSALDQRLDFIISSSGLVRRQGVAEESRRKRSVEDILRELDEKQKSLQKRRARPSLLLRMRQAGLNWSKMGYWLLCFAIGIVIFVMLQGVMGLGLFPSAGFALASGLALPHLYVSLRRKGRFARFTAEFANAIEIVVRGVKSGLPLIDCLKIIATEAQEPVKGEIKKVVEDQAMGMSLDEAMERLPDRVPLPEASFFAIVIAIQSRSGGSLSEALGNLAKVLRDRKKMQAKIKAMSSEAKASAGIIGALPLFVAGAIYLTSPQYISLLFSTTIGNVVLYICGVWMLMGVLVMRKMISFDF